MAVLKGKGFPYSLPSVGPVADPGVQAVSPQVIWTRGAPDPEFLDPAGSGSTPDPEMLDRARSGTRLDPNALDPAGSGSSMILALPYLLKICIVKTSFYVRINSKMLTGNSLLKFNVLLEVGNQQIQNFGYGRILLRIRILRCWIRPDPDLDPVHR